MKTETVKSFLKKFDETKEQTVEFDVVLPDYYPEVNQILKCTVVPATESVTSAGDKLSVSGNARATVVFSGAGGEIRVFEMSQKYTKVLQRDTLSDGDKCFVSQDTTQLNYRATAPRRLEIRASVAVGVSAYGVRNCEIVSDFEDCGIEQRCESFNSFELTGAEKITFEITDTVKLPDGTGSEFEQIGASGEVFVRETKVIKNKVMLKGSCTADFVTVSSDGNVRRFTEEIPFTEIREVYGADENCTCAVSVSLKSVRIAAKSGNEASFTAEAEAVVFAFSKCTHTAAVDAFSLKCDCETRSENAHVIKETVSVDTTVGASLETDTYDPSAAEILAAFTDGVRFGCSRSEGGNKLNGTCVFNAIVKNTSGAIFTVSRTAAFECALPDGDDYFLSVSPSSIGAELLSSGKIAFSASFGVKGFAVAGEDRTFVTDCAVSEQTHDARKSGIAVYYANAGENLWDIAKENRCRVCDIKELNGIESDVTADARAVIFPVVI